MSYEYWQNALKGDVGEIHEGDPRPGFYRKRTGKGAGYVPVAIWDRDGKIVAVQDGRSVDACDIWTYCADKPITHEQYNERMSSGRWWDEDAALAESLAHDPSNAADPVESLKDQIEAALSGVGDYTEIKDDTAAAKAQGLRSRLLELSGDADKRRGELVRPFLDGEKATNAVWMPLVKTSKDGANAIRAALSAWETKKDRKAKAKAAAEAQKASQEAFRHAPLGAEPPKPVPAPVAAPAAPIKGAYGRAASVKTVKVAIVKDQDAAYKQFREHPQVVVLIQTLANAAVKAGGEVAGCEIEEVKDIR